MVNKKQAALAACFCDPAGAQTQNLQNRNLTLYSIELRGPVWCVYYFLSPNASKM